MLCDDIRYLTDGFIIEDAGKWPYVLNMNRKYPEEPMPNYFN